jgi:hypothetical protein
MMRTGLIWTTLAICASGAACVENPAPVAGLPVETQVSFLNLSQTTYVQFGIRESGTAVFTYTPLLAPGATVRQPFLSAIAERCPGNVDVQVAVYRRVNADVPIGLDPGEAVEPIPIAAGQLDNIPACSLQVLETFTIVSWDAPDGTARVRIAQCSSVDVALQTTGVVPTADGAWEVVGVDPQVVVPTPASADISPITGRVVMADGSGVEGVLVILRTRFRSRLDCADPEREGDAGYSDPITYTLTDADGAFVLERPAGVYRLEFYSDVVAFRPGNIDVETPQDALSILAEPL